MNEPAINLELSGTIEKILQAPVALYEYIKKFHGIENSEKSGHDSIEKSVRISLPGIETIPGSRTSYSIHLEESASAENIYPDAKDLCFGVHWPEGSSSWTRLIAVEACVQSPLPVDTEPNAQCRYEVLSGLLFGHEPKNSLIAKIEFLKILEAFINQY